MFVVHVMVYATERSSNITKKDQGLHITSDDSRSGSIVSSKYVVIIGASYAADWPVTNIAGVKIINKGVGGEQTDEILDRFQNDVIELKPDSVIIWGFINDIFRSQRPEMEATLSSVKHNLKEMISIARKNNIRPILATEVTISRSAPDSFIDNIKVFIAELIGKESYQKYINKNVQATNNWIKDYAQKNDIIVLDIQSVMSDKDGYRKKEYSADDGSHITKSAYAALAEFADKDLAGKLY